MLNIKRSKPNKTPSGPPNLGSLAMTRVTGGPALTQYAVQRKSQLQAILNSSPFGDPNEGGAIYG
jgi:hypothetical protein